MNSFITEGYEGAVLRSMDSEYIFSTNARRSNTTLKYKRRLDLEVHVVAFTHGAARDSGAIVFIC
jgi:ATP-dependent DNA ligase